MGRSTKGLIAGMGLFSVAAILGTPAQAYTPTLTPSGVNVRWPAGAKFNVAANTQNSYGFAASDFQAAVIKGLQRWQTASAGILSFDVWFGTDQTNYPSNSEYNGTSSIYFASNATGATNLTPNIIGLTQVWYNTDTGEIMESDTALNDVNFEFTTDPTDTTGSGSGAATSYAGNRSKVFIENVVTHELGHAFGLSHSGVLQSTMMFMESPDQAHLGCDEQTGIHAVYAGRPTTYSDAEARGSLSGSVVSSAGGAIFGAQVSAISRRRGLVMGGTLTDKSGNFTIGALEPGEYFLMIEPFLAGDQALPAFYSTADSSVCPNGRNFGRTFPTASDGFTLLEAAVPSGGSVSVGSLTAQCTANAGADVMGIVSSTTAQAADAPTIYDSTTGASGFGVIDNANTQTGNEYVLHAVSGHVEVRALSFSLYSPVHPVLALTDMSGNTVTAQLTDPAYTSESGYVNYDSILTADGLAEGDYVVHVKSSLLNSTLYPAGSVMLDSQPFLLVEGSVNEGDPVLASTIPTNARCREAEDFSAYTSPGGNPPKSQASGDNQVGFCGSIRSDDGGSGSGGPRGPGPGAGAIFGWFLPWLVMGIGVRQIRHASRLASRPLQS